MSLSLEQYDQLLSEANDMLFEIEQAQLYTTDVLEKKKLANQARQLQLRIEQISGIAAQPTAPGTDALEAARQAILLGKEQVQSIINNNYGNTYNIGGQGNVVNTGGDRVINTGGGSYIGGNVSNSGGINVFGGKVGDITYHDNRGATANADEAKLKALFVALLQKIETAPVSAQDKADAKEAVEMLQNEVDLTRKDPDYKPRRATMIGIIATLDSLGEPVAAATMSVIGSPVVGTALNQFARK